MITLSYRLRIDSREARWKEKDQLFQGRDGGDEKWLESRCILKEEGTGFLTILSGL